MSADLTTTREELWEASKDLGDDMVDAGADPDKVAHAVAVMLDRVFPFDELVPGLAGVALEAGDGPAFERVVRALITLFRGDPVKRAERRAKRAVRKAERQANRAKG